MIDYYSSPKKIKLKYFKNKYLHVVDNGHLMNFEDKTIVDRVSHLGKEIQGGYIHSAAQLTTHLSFIKYFTIKQMFT